MSQFLLHKIYGLADPDTKEIKYIGQTLSRLGRRLVSHISSARRGKPKTGRKREWILDLLVRGKRPLIILLEECGDDWRPVEKKWISATAGLFNTKQGGAGGEQKRIGTLSPEIVCRLGTVTHSALAKEIGITRKAISYHRELRGIAAGIGLQRRVAPPRNWRNQEMPLMAECISQLGTMPDYKLGKLFNISKRTVARARARRGIASYAASTGNDGRIKIGDPHRRWARA